MVTLAPGRGRSRGSVLHPRTCAAVTAASCLAHLFLVAGNQHGTWLNVLMLAMVAVCLPCAVHIWRHSQVSGHPVRTVSRACALRGAGAVRRVMASALAMTGVHAALLLGAGAGAAGHTHQGAAASAAATAPAVAASPAGAGAMLAVIALELTTALVAATLLARFRAHPGD